MLLFLVHDDQAEILERREYRGACADGDLGDPAADALILVQSLTQRQRAVEHRDLVTKMRAEHRDHLRRERDLGYHHDDVLAVARRLLDQLEEHRGLARTGDAVEQ